MSGGGRLSAQRVSVCRFDRARPVTCPSTDAAADGAVPLDATEISIVYVDGVAQR